jgi:hypothetical protein
MSSTRNVANRRVHDSTATMHDSRILYTHTHTCENSSNGYLSNPFSYLRHSLSDRTTRTRTSLQGSFNRRTPECGLISPVSPTHTDNAGPSPTAGLEPSAGSDPHYVPEFMTHGPCSIRLDSKRQTQFRRVQTAAHATQHSS